MNITSITVNEDLSLTIVSDGVTMTYVNEVNLPTAASTDVHVTEGENLHIVEDDAPTATA